MTNELLLLLHAASTLAMVGLIWFVQIVHYPLFRRVGVESFPIYEGEHQRRTGWVVVPLMLSEAATAALLPFLLPKRLPATLTGLALLVLIWLSTFALQVPLHRRLSSGLDRRALRRLVSTNWIRTVGWSGRGLIALYLIWSSVGGGSP